MMKLFWFEIWWNLMQNLKDWKSWRFENFEIWADIYFDDNLQFENLNLNEIWNLIWNLFENLFWKFEFEIESDVDLKFENLNL